MEKKKLIIILGILAVLVTSVIIYFFIKNNYKNLKSGNNMSNKNLKEIEEYILSIRSYNAKIEVEIQSNKNKNKYVLEQKYAEPNVQKQIVLEPSNIEGLETIFDGNNLKINNTKLNLSTIYENYSDVTSNFLWLNTFTEEYKKMIETGKQNIIEQNGKNISIIERSIQKY